MKITNKTILALGAVAMLSAPALARTSLRDDARITNELTVAAVADSIRKTCPNISGRMTTAFSKAMALQSYAKSLGYSSDEIQDFINSKAEQSRIFGLRDQYLANHGVKKGDVDAYCRLGYEEIQKGSLMGSILKKN